MTKSATCWMSRWKVPAVRNSPEIRPPSHPAPQRRQDAGGEHRDRAEAAAVLGAARVWARFRAPAPSRRSWIRDRLVSARAETWPFGGTLYGKCLDGGHLNQTTLWTRGFMGARGLKTYGVNICKRDKPSVPRGPLPFRRACNTALRDSVPLWPSPEKDCHMSGAAVDLAHLARYTGGDAALNAEILRLFDNQASEIGGAAQGNHRGARRQVLEDRAPYAQRCGTRDRCLQPWRCRRRGRAHRSLRRQDRVRGVAIPGSQDRSGSTSSSRPIWRLDA